MGFWDWFKPKPKPPKPPDPVEPARLAMHVVVRKTDGSVPEHIRGQMGRPEWSVAGKPLSYYMLEFVAPEGYAYGQPVSLLIQGDDCEDLPLEVPFAADLNVILRPAVVNLPPLERRGQFYFQNGQPFTIIESSAFRLYEHFLAGRDVTPFLADCQAVGFNTLRVWLLNTSVGHIVPGEHPDFYQRIPELMMLCARYGLYVEFTVFTQTQSLMPSLAQQQAHYDATVTAIGSPFCFVEGVNENDSHDNAIDPVLRFWKPAGATFDLCRGSNGSDAWVVEPVLESARYHSNDANEWWRKPKSAMEMADQYHVPAWANENTRPDHDSNPHHHEDAARVGCLLSAGYCHHDNTGKDALVARAGSDRGCAVAAVFGAKSVDLSQRVFPYQHPQHLENEMIIRAYQRGSAIAPVRLQ